MTALPRIDDNDFVLFGLPERHAIDRALLDERRRDLHSRVHPDRFAAADAAAQRLAMQWAVRVNQAYQRLGDPLRRAAYLCELRGAPIDAERNTAMPAQFLARQMQWREALEDATTLQAVQQLDEQVAAEERAALGGLAEELDARGDTAAAAAQVRALMFVARFREDIARRIEALHAR